MPIAEKQFRDHADYLRQLNESIAKYQFQRDAAFLFLNENVGGFQCVPLTLRKYLTLRIWNSPFLPPFETPRPSDIWEFLWLVSPGYKPGQNKEQQEFFARCRKMFQPPKRPARWKLRFKFFRSAYKARRKLVLWRAAKITAEIREYVSDALADRPMGKVSQYIPEPDYYSDICGLVASMAREFGGGIGRQQIESLLDLPLKVRFQFSQERLHHIAAQIPDGQPKPVLANPWDRVSNRYLMQLNAEMKKAQPKNN